MPVDPADQGEERWKRMVEMRAEKFLVELEELFHLARTKTGEAGRN
jgi:hypothetical protein